MVDYIVLRPFGLVFIVVAHVVFDGHTQAKVTTGALGSNITLQFTFNMTDTSMTSVGLYRFDRLGEEKKIHECCFKENCSERQLCVYNATSVSASYCITNLRPNDSGTYWVSMFIATKTSRDPLVKSNPVFLAVRQENTAPTVPPTPTITTDTNANGSLSSRDFTLLLVFTFLCVSVVVLSAGLLSWFTRRNKRTKEQRQHDPTATVQEATEASGRLPACSLVYSVLDFPRRHQGGVEIQPTDTEYAAITHLPKQGLV